MLPKAEVEEPNRFVGAPVEAAGAPKTPEEAPPKGFLLALSAEACPPSPENIPPPPPPLLPKSPPLEFPAETASVADVPKTEVDEALLVTLPKAEPPKEGVAAAPNSPPVAGAAEPNVGAAVEVVAG